MALLLSRTDVAVLLTVDEAIQVVEEAFRQLALGQVTMPQRTVIRLLEHRGLHLGMPAYIGGTIRRARAQGRHGLPGQPVTAPPADDESACCS